MLIRFLVNMFYMKYVDTFFNKLVDINTSISDDTLSPISISIEKIVCLVNDIFMFSFLLSFIIDL